MPLKPTAVSFWILLAVIVATPLALAPGLQFFDITPKLLVLLPGACLVWLALAVRGQLPAPSRDQTVFFLLLGGLAVAAVLATVFSVDPMLSLVGSEGRRLGLPAWLACLALAAAVPAAVNGDRRRKRLLPAALVAAAVVASLYGFAQYAGFDPWINPALYHVGVGEHRIVRPPSTLGHANYFAAFSLLALFAAIGLALTSPTRRARTAWAVAIALLGLGVVVSGSRGAWLGAGAGVLVLFSRLGRRRGLIRGLVAAALLTAIFIASPAGLRVRVRIASLSQDPGSIARLQIWLDSARLVFADPLLGSGPDAFELAFPRVQSLRLAERVPDHYAESPHNILLDYLTSAGIPALLLFVLLVATAIRSLRVSSRAPEDAARDPESVRDATMSAALLAALVSSLVVFQFIADTISTRLALLVVAALSVSTFPQPAEPLHAPVRAALWARIAVAVAAFAGLGAALWFGIRLARADRAVLVAGRSLSRGNLDEALRAGRAARQAFPWTGSHDFVFSRALGAYVTSPGIALTQRGPLLAVTEETAHASLLHSAQPQMVHVHLASIQVLQGKQDEAQASLEAAIQAAPAWYRPHWLLAVLLAVRGRDREAAQQAEAALQRGARRHPQIAASLDEIRRLAPERKPPPPGEFEYAQAGPRDRFNLCGGRTLVTPDMRFERAPSPVLSPGREGAWDSVDLLNPSVVVREGELQMFYSGFDGSVWRTGLARSRDGVTWEKHPRPVLDLSAFGWDAEYIAANGTVLLEKGTLFHWYQGGRTARIGLASSSDGITWNKHPAPVLEPGPAGSWDSKAVADPYAVRCGETLYLYYLGQDSTDTQRLGVASSRDGIHWAKYPRNPILNLGTPGSFDERSLGEPAVVPVSRGLAMFYTGRDAKEFRRIGLALSADGVTWRKSGVALDVARSGWDSRVVAAPHVAVAADRLRMWYGGGDVASPDQNLHGRIGLTTARALQGLPLFLEHAAVAPSGSRTDTPNGRWAFPYKESSLVTLPGASLTFTAVIPERARLRATVRMPLAGAEPARAVVRVQQAELFSELVQRELDLNLDLRRFAGQRVELRLAALPGPRGQRASWVEWWNPRVVVE